MSETYYKLLEISRRTQERHFTSGDSTILCQVAPMGVGKTKRIETYAKRVEYDLDTIILGRMSNLDVGGLYAPDKEYSKIVHLVTRRLVGGDEHRRTKGSKGLIIHFDELGSASPETQVAIQSLIQDRMLEGVRVPDWVMFVASTNLPEHTGGANDLVASLRSRLTFIDYQFDYKEWLKLARTEWDVIPEIYSFHAWSEGRNMHVFDSNSNALSSPDPRAWSKVNNAFMVAMEIDGYERLTDMYRLDQTVCHTLLKGKIGEKHASEFMGFMKFQADLPTVSEILEKPRKALVPKRSDAGTAIIHNLAHHLSKREAEEGGFVDQEDLEAVYTYLRRMDRTIAVMGFRTIEQASKSFTSGTPEYQRFRNDFSDLFTY